RERLDTFERSIANTSNRPAGLEVVEAPAHSAIKTAKLALRKPDSSPLLTIEGLELAAGEMSVLHRRAGSGAGRKEPSERTSGSGQIHSLACACLHLAAR